MIRISAISVPEGSDIEHLKSKASHMLGLHPSELKDFRIIKRSKDARKRNNILDVYTVIVGAKDEDALLKKYGNRNISSYQEERYVFPTAGKGEKKFRPVISGFGPAGIFAALILSHEGYRPLVIEKGKSIGERTEDVEAFFEKGVLDPSSNVQFGEGGAGAFSDGKLSTGVKDREGRKRFILDTFVRHGADSSILTDSHPHIGTDRLREIIPSIRREIESLGGEIRFRHALSDIEISDGSLSGIIIKGEGGTSVRQDCDCLFLCIGHSARETFSMLYDQGISMETKAFAVGVRAEHKRALIDKGLKQEKASYKLTYHCADGRGVYSFCMCPGGYVINASSEEGHLTVNGMSFSARDGENSNAAIVCTISPEDYIAFGNDALAGVRFQRDLEERAYRECGGAIPYQRYDDFSKNRSGSSYGNVRPGTKGRFAMGNIRNILPSYITDDIIEAMPAFGRRIPGFDSGDTLFAGIEARTSSPVRILRGEDMQSVNVRGIYPAGEGAGYAGGIMSAAIDGIKAAESYIKG